MLRQFFPPILHPPPPRATSLLAQIPFTSTADPKWSPSYSSPYSFVQILSSAAKSFSLSTGQQTHSSILKLGLISNVFISTALLDLYSKCCRFSEAQKLFDEMPQRNSVTWNALIYSHSQSPNPTHALKSFKEMILLGFSLTPFSISSVLVASSHIGDLRTGEMVHCVGVKHGVCSNLVVGTSLVDVYSRCCDVCSARKVFDGMGERNVITWTSLVTGYALDQRPQEAMSLFREMKIQGVQMNRVTYNSLLTSFTVFEDLGHGKQVHCLVIKEGLDSDPFISVTLVTMYSKCGSLEDFVNLYPDILIHDQVSCNSIIAGFSHLGNDTEVLRRFLHMRRESMEVDFFTFASVLRAIGVFSSLQDGKQTHALILKSGHMSNVCVQNGLVSMYARCGVIDDSEKVFSSMEEPNIVSWNSLLSGCAQHGYCIEALRLFEQMRTIRIKPNSTTFLSVLSACSHAGLVDKGLEYFNLMRQCDSSIVARLEHYTCMVDLLGRAGYLDEAEAFINTIPMKPDLKVYRALLSACKVHGNLEMAKRAARRAFEICPSDPSAFVLLSSVLAGDECWESACGLRGLMAGKGVKKEPAWSLVDERVSVM
ncbi:uncharacterized protein A4U43_C05F3060 [Asparagus officinalis]|uniref:Pentacotripeptide-repeat region of PRORP domain-containing protein n=1 Tax=Asparagus officinalis TaxID=4686 RepID=A0A5P1ET53_ASPOF|nr:pentatricopeptide repeat-containing protein At1g11290, chloroplastic-like [Asparagus officinalis]XP_020267627.1 pentatricopeptide repeat-containing protein At1g11290, chloroplastic-like [Asparagus officinalis]XP_020267628.1 pentatricopeptide repeat-containing protein At1g11290, chloroplastic-like [Asparagus officinalis]ONK67721.1 uncharacterized protein A4U43_C05F3060 [Asparagus officinalis]